MAPFPAVQYHFQVQIDGKKIGFKEVSGLVKTYDLIEYRDGLDPLFTNRKEPGLVKYENVTLKRGTFQGDFNIDNWWSNQEKRDIVISLLDDTNNPIINWKLRKTWPLTIKTSDLNADSSEVAIEELVLVHEGFNREDA